MAKLKQTQAGDVLCERQEAIGFAPLDLPAPVMAFAYEPKSKGDEEKAAAAVRRLGEEDPTLDVHRDAQTGEQIVAGLTQVHVEVIVERMKRRFGAEIELHPPRVPYQETIREPAEAHARYKKQSGGRGQFADCRIEIEPAEDGAGLDFVNRIKGAAIPGGFIPAVREGGDGGDAARHGRRLPGARTCASVWSTANTTTSTPPRWPSRSLARWPSARRWKRPIRCCSSRSCGSRSAAPTTWSAT